MSKDLFIIPEKGFDSIKASYNEVYQNNDFAERTVGLFNRGPTNIGNSTTIKGDYTRSDYNSYRSNYYDVYKNRKALLETANLSYRKVGIIKNVIDLMSDFGCKGIKLSHKVPSVERFYREWFKKVEGIDRSERFLSCLYRLGCVIIYITEADISKETVDNMKKISASQKKSIPLKYTMLNPTTIEVIGENLGILSSNPIYVLNMTNMTKTVLNDYMLKKDKDEILKTIVKNLPQDIKDAYGSKKNYVPLKNEFLHVYNYRKDDWQPWGSPITECIFDDLEVLEKLKLADISALDGAISNIRLWRIGRLTDNPQTTILPTKEIIDKLRNILSNNISGGTLDLVWGPELDFKESTTSVHNFLGEEKYRPTIDSIYDGLGIPSPLRSSSTGSSSNNYISLKTLVERLQYGRNLLLDFWNKEVKKVQKTLGFAEPAVVEFDNMVLTDEAAINQLLINLVDRDIIDQDSVLERFNFNPKIVKSKLKREVKQRGDKIPHKISPFSQHEQEMKKVALSGGAVTPSEVGLDLEEKKEGQKSRQELTNEVILEKNKSMMSGRPKNITETSKRKKKTTNNQVRIKGSSIYFWANSAQKKIHDILLKGLDSIFEKKSLRELSTEEADTFEKLKRKALFNMQAFSDVNEESIIQSLAKNTNNVYENSIKFLSLELQKSLNRDLTLEEVRQVSAIVYASYQEEKDGSN